MANLISPVSRHILFPIHEKLKGHNTMACLRELEITQYYDRQQIEGFQAEKLRYFIAGAYDNVPYYRRLFDDNMVNPSDICATEDLAKVPFLTKSDIRENLSSLRSGRSGKLQKFNTGGSTGEPMIFYIGKKRVSYDVAAKLRATRWWGVDIGDPEIVIWGSSIELSKQDRIRQFRDWIFQTRLLSAFDMTEERMLEYVRTIREMRPAHIFGYPSSISILAKHARDNNIRLDDLGVKVVFCTAEKLYEHQKDLISETFNAPVANGYGGRDAGFIAHECPEGKKMHITSENIIVEIIDAGGKRLPPGQSGEIVITHLETDDFPFIRYRTGDIGKISDDPCPCGRGLPVLEDIEGRTTDFIVTPEGKIMHGLALIYVLREVPGVEEFKIIQKRQDFIIVLIVKNHNFKMESESLIIHGLQKRLGEKVNVELEYVSGIQSEKSGKFRYVVSEVQPPL
jgi:phenylacetate-CoA ligase